MKKLLFVLINILILKNCVLVTAAGPNYASSKETYQLYYDGYIQMQSAYYDWEFGGHVYNGHMRYTNNASIDSGRIYVGPGKSASDGTIYSSSYRQWDTMNPIAPKTRFYYNFNVAPTNAWPMYRLSLDEQKNNWSIENTFSVGGFIEH